VDSLTVELWREIIDSLGDAVVALSPSYDPIAANAALETLLGTSHINQSTIDRLLRQNQWLARMVDACLETGQSLDSPEAVLALDRRSTTVRAAASRLHNQQGKFEGVVLLFHDLSIRKKADHAYEPEDGFMRLSPAGLAHEVRNPLTGIKGAAELLGTMFPADLRAQQYCRLILDGVSRIAGLVEQVLAVSNPQRLKREPVNIHQVLHQSLRMAGLYPQSQPGITVEQRFDPSLPELTGDSSALERVFLNLIRNALEAIEEAKINVGGAAVQENHTVRLRTAMETDFRLSARGRRRQFLRVEVSDTGKGMTSQEIKQLFTPFFTTKPAGTGLGLVLSQRIVALHGGKLWAEPGGQTVEASEASFSGLPSDPSQPPEEGRNSERRGMTFCITLPVGTD
jgi:two-component system, NtrC family, nitrogen regulation sensor histidine kinase GlnL